MKVHFLGTAAFEGIPALFCSCDLCKQASKLGGRNIRTRTSVMIDDELKIDFPPDTFLHMLRDGLDLDQVRDLLFTHSHSDHLYADDLAARLPGFARSGEQPIHIYAGDLPIQAIHEKLSSNGGHRGKYELHRVRPFQRTVMDTAVITPLPADHDRKETCLLYIIEKGGCSILYGHDSGYFPEETWTVLGGKRMDLVILECTMGRGADRTNHMGVDAVLETKERMLREGIAGKHTRFVVTHFSHNAGLLHEELERVFGLHGILVAYDAMKLEL